MQKKSLDLIDRRKFIAAVGGTAALAAMTSTEKADALEAAMSAELEKLVVKPRLATTYGLDEIAPERKPGQLFLMGHDPRLPEMSKKPTLLEFFEKRFGNISHSLQSATLALKAGLPEKTILACLLHDISVDGLLRADHGYWGAQLVAPYVDEEVSWAIRYHQCLRFFADPDVDYTYPEAYLNFFGEDFKPEPYLERDANYAKNHKWYMTARHITINDVYAFDPNAVVSLDDFVDIIGRHFREPEEGLGFDNSPSSHMWRTMNMPNRFL